MADASASVNYIEEGGGRGQMQTLGMTPKILGIGHLDIVNNYRTGGVDVSSIAKKFTQLHDILFVPKDGYFFVCDTESWKVKLYTPAAAHTHSVALDGGVTAAGAAHTHTFAGASEPPPIVVEESQAVTDNVCTLDHIPLYIVAIHVTAGDVTGAFRPIPTGKTPLTKQAAVTFATGVLTFLESDGVTAVKVTYIPKRSNGYLSEVTVDESITANEAKVNLAARAGLIQYTWDDTDGVIIDYEQPGTAPHATHYCTIDINDSGNTSFDCHADDATNTWLVTYVPFSQLPPGCFIDDTDITLSSEGYNFTGDGHFHHLIVPGYGCQVIGETAEAALTAAIWEGPSGSAANGIATWNPATNAILTDQNTAMSIISMPWMIFDVNQLQPNTPVGTNAAESTHTHGPGTLADTQSGSGSATGAAGELDDNTAVDIEDILFIAIGI
jgi:hypothetical protein